MYTLQEWQGQEINKILHCVNTRFPLWHSTTDCADWMILIWTDLERRVWGQPEWQCTHQHTPAHWYCSNITYIHKHRRNKPTHHIYQYSCKLLSHPITLTSIIYSSIFTTFIICSINFSWTHTHTHTHTHIVTSFLETWKNYDLLVSQLCCPSTHVHRFIIHYLVKIYF